VTARYILSGMASRLLGGAMVGAALLSLAFPVVAQDKAGRVGLLSNGNTVRAAGQPSTWRDALLLSLDQNGYRLGLNLELVDRHSEGHVDRLPGIAREIATASVDVVVAVSDPSVRAMLAATRTTPIVMVVGADPVTAGFVDNLARPGGRVTGLAFQVFEGDAKRLQILRDVIPDARRFGRLEPPGQSAQYLARAAELMSEAAGRLGIELTIRQVARLEPEAYAAAAVEMRDEGVAGVLIAASQAWAGDVPVVGRIALEYGLPTICEWGFQARTGCVLAYGHDLDYAQRRIGWYAARILTGTAPTDLPVEQSDAWKLTINLQAVTRLGLTIPLSILGRADEVIE
jgi:putative tryptophan/tyrosine transport system substrate-binding protein